MERLLAQHGFRVVGAETGQDALRILGETPISLVLVDYGLPDTDGVALTRRISAEHRNARVIALTGKGDVALAERMYSAGAVEFFDKPIDDQARFFATIRRNHDLAEKERGTPNIEPLGMLVAGGPRNGVEAILGKSPRTIEVKRLIREIPPMAQDPVLILGESGVGKMEIAKALHHESARRAAPFMHEILPNIATENFEAELFGTAMGRYTAVRETPGLCRKVGDGTLFLDEVGDLAMSHQAKLLRLIQDRNFRPVGSDDAVPFKGRLIFATNKDLHAEVAAGRFRQDLLNRIAVFRIVVPPLRERIEDIPELVTSFVQTANRDFQMSIRRVAPDAMEYLLGHSWRFGNVRELQACIRTSAPRARHAGVLKREHIHIESYEPLVAWPSASAAPPAASPPPPAAPAPGPDGAGLSADELGPWGPWMDMSYQEAKKAIDDAFSKVYLRQRLIQSNGNKSEAAARSGVERPNFYKLLDRYDIEVPAPTPVIRTKR